MGESAASAWPNIEVPTQPPTISGSPDLTLAPAPPPEAPTRFVHNRDSIPDRPDTIMSIGGRYEFTDRATLGDDPASVQVSRSALAGNLVFGPEHDLQFSFPVDWEVSQYSFRDADEVFPGGSKRMRNVQQIVFAPNVEAKIDQNWGVFGGGLLIDAGQFSASDTTTYGGFGGVIWRSGDPEKTFTIRLGLGARSRLEDDIEVLPAFWMEWRIDERTRLTSQGNNIRFEYDFAPAWCVKLDAAFESRDYRLNDSSPGAGAVLRDRQIPITARLEFVPHAAVRFETWVGVNLYRQFTVDLEQDHRFYRDEADPSIIVGVSFEIIF